MAARLTKRSSPKDVEAPKPLPARGKEPDTYLCEDARTVVTAAERVPSMGMCEKCHINPAHSEVDHLCYNCHKAAKGFVFDEDKNRFIKDIERYYEQNRLRCAAEPRTTRRV